MWLTIHLQSLDIDNVVREHVERRLSFALSRLEDQIEHVTVHLIDENGPRGGRDKRCRVVVEVLRRNRVVVEDTDSDLKAAINRAANRVRLTVRRKVDRAQWYARLMKINKN